MGWNADGAFTPLTYLALTALLMVRCSVAEATEPRTTRDHRPICYTEAMLGGAYVYILECSDGSFYVGSTRHETVDQRVGEHQNGKFAGYTFTRRPVKLMWAEHFKHITDAVSFEQRIKRWSRAKKLALIRGDWALLSTLAKRRGGRAG